MNYIVNMNKVINLNNKKAYLYRDGIAWDNKKKKPILWSPNA